MDRVVFYTVERCPVAGHGPWRVLALVPATGTAKEAHTGRSAPVCRAWVFEAWVVGSRVPFAIELSPEGFAELRCGKPLLEMAQAAVDTAPLLGLVP